MPKKPSNVLKMDDRRLARCGNLLENYLDQRMRCKEQIGKVLIEVQELLVAKDKFTSWMEKYCGQKYGFSLRTAYNYIEIAKKGCANLQTTTSAAASSGGSRRGSGGARSHKGTGTTTAGPGNSAAASPPPSPAPSIAPGEGGTGGAPTDSPSAGAPPTLEEISAFLGRLPGSQIISQLAPYLSQEFGLRLSMDAPAAPAVDVERLQAELLVAQSNLRLKDIEIEKINRKNDQAADDYVRRKETEIRGLNARMAVLEEENNKLKGEGAYARNSEGSISTKDAEQLEQRIETLGRRLADADQENARLHRVIEADVDRGALANQAIVIDKLRKEKADLQALLERVRAMPPAMYGTKMLTFEPEQRHEIMRIMATLDAAEPGAMDSEKADWVMVLYGGMTNERYKADIFAQLTKIRATAPRMRGASQEPPPPVDYQRRAAPGELLKPNKDAKRGNGKERPPSVPEGDY